MQIYTNLSIFRMFDLAAPLPIQEILIAISKSHQKTPRKVKKWFSIMVFLACLISRTTVASASVTFEIPRWWWGKGSADMRAFFHFWGTCIPCCSLNHLSRLLMSQFFFKSRKLMKNFPFMHGSWVISHFVKNVLGRQSWTRKFIYYSWLARRHSPVEGNE